MDAFQTGNQSRSDGELPRKLSTSDSDPPAAAEDLLPFDEQHDYDDAFNDDELIWYSDFRYYDVMSSAELSLVYVYEDVNDTETDCIISQNLGYTVFSTVGAFYLPLAFIVAVYLNVYRVARSRIHRRQFNRRRDDDRSGAQRDASTVDPDIEVPADWLPGPSATLSSWNLSGVVSSTDVVTMTGLADLAMRPALTQTSRRRRPGSSGRLYVPASMPSLSACPPARWAPPRQVELRPSTTGTCADLDRLRRLRQRGRRPARSRLRHRHRRRCHSNRSSSSSSSSCCSRQHLASFCRSTPGNV